MKQMKLDDYVSEQTLGMVIRHVELTRSKYMRNVLNFEEILLTKKL